MKYFIKIVQSFVDPSGKLTSSSTILKASQRMNVSQFMIFLRITDASIEQRSNQIMSNGKRYQFTCPLFTDMQYQRQMVCRVHIINIICEHFYIISPDEKHDQQFVHYVQKSISEYLNSMHYYVTVMHEFCDGCQCQCKSRNCFGNFVESVEEFGY